MNGVDIAPAARMWVSARWPEHTAAVMDDLRRLVATVPTGSRARFGEHQPTEDLALLAPLGALRVIARGQLGLIRVELAAIGDTLLTISGLHGQREIAQVAPYPRGRAPFSMHPSAAAMLPRREFAGDIARLAEWVQLMTDWLTTELDGDAAPALEHVRPVGDIQVYEWKPTFVTSLVARGGGERLGRYDFDVKEAIVDHLLGDLDGLVSSATKFVDGAR